jgi:hypothetical protein
MPLSKNDHMVQALAANRTDQSLHVGPLPGAGPSAEDFFNVHALDSLAKIATVDFVLISQQVAGRGIFRRGLNHLPPCPESRVNHTPAR